jgi:hypothetical protein
MPPAESDLCAKQQKFDSGKYIFFFIQSALNSNRPRYVFRGTTYTCQFYSRTQALPVLGSSSDIVCIMDSAAAKSDFDSNCLTLGLNDLHPINT